MKVFDSSPAYESTTALGEAFARAQSTDPLKMTPTCPDGAEPKPSDPDDTGDR